MGLGKWLAILIAGLVTASAQADPDSSQAAVELDKANSDSANATRARLKYQEREKLSAEEEAYTFDVRGRKKNSRAPASLESAVDNKGNALDPKASEDPWLGYMAQTSTSALASQVKGSPALKEKMLGRLRELKNDPKLNAEKIEFLEAVLEASEKPTEAEKLGDLSPLDAKEIFFK